MSIKINSLSKSYGTQKAVDSLSLELQAGELVGFLGPNGAGKSTTMKIITGYLAADEGQVFIDDELMSPNNHKLRQDIGYLPEHNPLYTDLFIKEYLSIVAGMYGLKNKKQRVAEVIEMTGLAKEQNKKVGALSKGYRQRVGLAQALIHNPKLLILDEPTTGLDPNQLEEIRSLIKEISKEKTVLFSTHIMQEVEAICDRVLIINNGKLVADGATESIKRGLLSGSQEVFVEFERAIEPSALSAIDGVMSVTPISGSQYMISADGSRDIRPLLFNYAVAQKLIILTIKEEQSSMEDVFQQLTKK